VQPDLPPTLDTLVALATSRDPDLRPADARHYLHAITEVRRGMPLPPATRREGQPAAAIGYGAPDLPAPAAPAATWPDGGVSNGSRQADQDSSDPAAPANGSAALPPAFVGRTVQYPPIGSPPEPGGRSGSPNHTMVVPVGDEPDYGGYGGGYRGHGHRSAGGYQEPWLQRWLFSRRVLVVPAVVLVGVLVWWLAAGRYATVPSVTGLSVSAARAELTSAGFGVANGHARNSNTVAAGKVISTSPAAGSDVSRGGRVIVIPSLGPVMVTMPEVTGQPLAQAQQAVRAAGLKAAAPTYQANSSVPAGVVIATNPGAFQRWPAYKPVQLVVSAGQPLPNFVGQQLGDVQAQAAAGGYTINPVGDTTSPQPAGTVTSQQPAQGTPITPNEVVTVDVSTGQGGGGGQSNGFVPVPNVTGMTQDQATSALQQAGFGVQVNQGIFGRRVTSYSPTGQAPQGTTITINIGYL
jgi:serine/threonine-protein kinase